MGVPKVRGWADWVFIKGVRMHFVFWNAFEERIQLYILTREIRGVSQRRRRMKGRSDFGGMGRLATRVTWDRSSKGLGIKHVVSLTHAFGKAFTGFVSLYRGDF